REPTEELSAGSTRCETPVRSCRSSRLRLAHFGRERPARNRSVEHEGVDARIENGSIYPRDLLQTLEVRERPFLLAVSHDRLGLLDRQPRDGGDILGRRAIDRDDSPHPLQPTAHEIDLLRA